MFPSFSLVLKSTTLGDSCGRDDGVFYNLPRSFDTNWYHFIMTSDQGSKHDPVKTQNKVRFAFEDDFLFVKSLKDMKAHFRVGNA